MREESGFLNMSLGEVAVGDEFNLSKVKWWSRVKKVGSLVYFTFTFSTRKKLSFFTLCQNNVF